MQYLDLIIPAIFSILIFGIFFYKLNRPSSKIFVKIGKSVIETIPENKEKIQQALIETITVEIKELYKRIYEHYSSNNLQSLAPLVSTPLYLTLYDEIKQNKKAGVLDNIIVNKIDSVDISFLPPQSSALLISAKIISNQLRYKLKDKKVIEGSKEKAIILEDNWTFKKESHDKPWCLYSMS